MASSISTSSGYNCRCCDTPFEKGAAFCSQCGVKRTTNCDCVSSSKCDVCQPTRRRSADKHRHKSPKSPKVAPLAFAGYMSDGLGAAAAAVVLIPFARYVAPVEKPYTTTPKFRKCDGCESTVLFSMIVNRACPVCYKSF
jgi:hypothetical protein